MSRVLLLASPTLLLLLLLHLEVEREVQALLLLILQALLLPLFKPLPLL
jgi:hypothetical protein